jgi:hypothetical protein
MEKSKINNPAIKEIWDRSIWTGQPNASATEKLFLSIIPAVMLLFAFIFAAYFLTTPGLEVIGICLGVAVLLLLIVILKTSRTARWRDPFLMFALSDGCIFFTGEMHAKSTIDHNASWFEESISNITSFTLKTDKDKTTVIINFAEPSYAGSYGKINALPLYRISNAEQLISILKGFGIKEEKK